MNVFSLNLNFPWPSQSHVSVLFSYFFSLHRTHNSFLVFFVSLDICLSFDFLSSLVLRLCYFVTVYSRCHRMFSLLEDWIVAAFDAESSIVYGLSVSFAFSILLLPRLFFFFIFGFSLSLSFFDFLFRLLTHIRFIVKLSTSTYWCAQVSLAHKPT